MASTKDFSFVSAFRLPFVLKFFRDVKRVREQGAIDDRDTFLHAIGDLLCFHSSMWATLYEYNLKGRSVWLETHGGTDGGYETDKVKLDFLDKVLASVSGHYGSICGTSVIIRSLTFWSNSSMYGPFSTKDGTLFLLPVSSIKII
ncbi:PYK10-binding protein 2 [Zea mays]|uniref:PYK10-binding protein 2 n=1 Tax=Zea mays TaxID=4577 RepID=A0A1D6G4J8_MAIZE|nr:PYK10-binding protein 2 [Zea mays]